MSINCPRCGKEDTIPFSDTVLKTHGFECQTCHKDFGVDDGHTFSQYEEELLLLEYERIGKDKTKKSITIEFLDDKTWITPQIVYSNKMLQPIEKQEITPMAESFKKLLFEQLYILDWNRINLGLITGSDESFTLKLKFKHKDSITFSGTNRFPPYLVVLDQLFEGFFELEK